MPSYNRSPSLAVDLASKSFRVNSHAGYHSGPFRAPRLVWVLMLQVAEGPSLNILPLNTLLTEFRHIFDCPPTSDTLRTQTTPAGLN